MFYSVYTVKVLVGTMSIRHRMYYSMLSSVYVHAYSEFFRSKSVLIYDLWPWYKLYRRVTFKQGVDSRDNRTSAVMILENRPWTVKETPGKSRHS